MVYRSLNLVVILFSSNVEKINYMHFGVIFVTLQRNVRLNEFFRVDFEVVNMNYLVVLVSKRQDRCTFFKDYCDTTHSLCWPYTYLAMVTSDLIRNRRSHRDSRIFEAFAF